MQQARSHRLLLSTTQTCASVELWQVIECRFSQLLTDKLNVLFLQWFARTHTRTAMPILAGHRAGATTTSLVPMYVPAVPWCAVSVLQVFPFQAVFCCKAREKDLTKCHKVNRKLRKSVVLLRAQRSKFLLCKFECKNTAQLTYRCK